MTSVVLTVVGKVIEPNKGKTLELNRALEEYLKLVRWYVGFGITSKTKLHELTYEEAKKRFSLNTALIQTARDKAVEILKSFSERKAEGRAKADRPAVKRVSIRLDRRAFKLDKSSTKLTPYWLVVSLRRGVRIALPLAFGSRQKQFIEETLQGLWELDSVELVKRDGVWFAHFKIKKNVVTYGAEEAKTLIGVDLGEWNAVAAVAISRDSPSRPMRGQFWGGQRIRFVRGKYAHIRRSLQRKKRLDLVKRIGSKEGRTVNQMLHEIAKGVVEYAKQFPKPVIVMEDLEGIRDRISGSNKLLNRRLQSWSFRKLQKYIEYKALLSGIPIVYVKPKNTSRTCHRCGFTVDEVKGREFRCPRCGLRYNRDLNAAINIALALTRGRGWGAVTPPRTPT